MIVTPGACHARIRAGGWDLDLSADTLADVTVTHGRTGFETGRAAVSTAQFTVRVREGQPAYWPLGQIGNEIRIETGGEGQWKRRHTGAISDVRWDWDEDGQGRYLAHKVTCTGHMSRLGATPMVPVVLASPAWQITDPVRDRVAYTLRNQPAHRIQTGDFNPALLPAEFDPGQSILDALEEWTWAGEAVTFDDTDGTAVWQELGYRRTTPIIDLPACAVSWAPSYRSSNDLVNAVWLEWGPPDQDGHRPAVLGNDGWSNIVYGSWHERWSTGYATQTGAQAKADRIVRRQAYPAVLMPSLKVLVNALTPAQWAAIAALRVGDRVRLPELPSPMPYGGPTQISGVMVVEGWTEHVGARSNPDRDWTLDIHVSPPVWSMLSRRWDDMTGAWADQGTKTWDQIGALT